MLIVVLIILYFFCAVNQIAASSGQLFAFARDKGLPFNALLSRDNPRSGLPVPSIFFAAISTSLMALIIIGSTIAFNIILSVSATGLHTSYIVVAGTILLKQLRGERTPPTKFSLGSWGLVVNILALCFPSVAFVFLFFPAVPKPDAASMNWTVLIYGFVLLFAGRCYASYGRKQDRGLVRDVGS